MNRGGISASVLQEQLEKLQLEQQSLKNFQEDEQLWMDDARADAVEFFDDEDGNSALSEGSPPESKAEEEEGGGRRTGYTEIFSPTLARLTAMARTPTN